MDTRRVGLVQSARAGFVALLAPVAAIAAAATVAIGAGGFDRLGTLGQLVSGPASPTAGIDRPGSVAFDDAAGALASIVPAGALAPGSGASPGFRLGSPRIQEGPEDFALPGDRELAGGRGGGAGAGGGGSVDEVEGGGGQVDTGGAVGALGDDAQDVTDQLPGPVGPAVGDAIDEVSDAAEQLPDVPLQPPATP